MKKLAVCYTIFWLLAGCTKSTDDSLSSLNVSPPYLTFGSKGGIKEVTVFASGDWSLSEGTTWCVPSVVTGRGQSVIRFAVDENDRPEKRTATFRFTSGSKTVNFVVEQAANRSLAMLDVLVPEYMEKNNVPAVSLAITYKERLVYHKTFGFQELDKRIPATNHNLFRVASVTKVVTLIGILKLVEQGKMTVHDKVFGDYGILGYDYGGKGYGNSFADDRMTAVTVDHLIQHKSGWMEPPLDLSKSLDEFIINAVTNVPLQYDPGTVFQYSNFDYILLWKIIEKVSGQDYHAFLQQHVFDPIGITEIVKGSDFSSERLPNEVCYYDNRMVQVDYVWGAGGIVASAHDLAKLLVHVDRNNTLYRDVLPATLFPPYLLSFGTWIHDGGCPGTTARATRMNDDICFVMLVNTDTSLEELDLFRFLENVTEWPDHNLFE